MPRSVRAVDRIALGLLTAVVSWGSVPDADATLPPAPFRLALLFDRPGWVSQPPAPVGVPAHLVDRLER